MQNGLVPMCAGARRRLQLKDAADTAGVVWSGDAVKRPARPRRDPGGRVPVALFGGEAVQYRIGPFAARMARRKKLVRYAQTGCAAAGGRSIDLAVRSDDHA